MAYRPPPERSIRHQISIAIMILAVGLGMAVLTTILNLLDALYLRGISVDAPNRVMVVGSGRRRGLGRGSSSSLDLMSYATFRSLRSQCDALEQLTAIGSFDVPLVIRQPPRPDAPSVRQVASARLVSADYFRLFGAKPVLGRLFHDVDEVRGPASHVAVLSDAYWRDRFSSRADIIGYRLPTAHGDVTVVGVVERSFRGERFWQPPDLWLPITAQGEIPDKTDILGDPALSWIIAMGRLRGDMTEKEARSRVMAALPQIIGRREGIARSRSSEIAATQPAAVLTPAPRGLVSGVEQLTTELLVMLVLALGAFICLCRFVVILRRLQMRGRPTAATSGGWPIHDAPDRAAPGLRMRQWGGIAFMVAVIGMGMATWLREQGVDLVAEAMSLRPDTAVTSRVYIVSFLMSGIAAWCVVGAPTGALAVLRLSRVRVPKTDAESHPQRRHFTIPAALILQIGSTVVAIYGVVVLFTNAIQAEQADTGISDSRVIVAMLNILDGHQSLKARLAMQGSLIRQLESVPGVKGAALASSMVLSSSQARSSVSVVDTRSGDDLDARAVVVTVTSSFFHVIGSQIVAGRALDDSDAEDAHVAVVNEAFVGAYFGTKPVIGASVSVGASLVTIVGVVANVLHSSVQATHPPVVYMPMSTSTQANLDALYVRTSGPAKQMLPEITRALDAFGTDEVFPRWTRTLDAHVHDAAAKDRVRARVAGTLACGVILVMLFGVYCTCLANERDGHTAYVRLRRGAAPVLVTTAEAWPSMLRAFAIAMPMGVLLAVGVSMTLRPSVLSATEWQALLLAVLATAVVAFGFATVSAWLTVRTYEKLRVPDAQSRTPCG